MKMIFNMTLETESGTLACFAVFDAMKHTQEINHFYCYACQIKFCKK